MYVIEYVPFDCSTVLLLTVYRNDGYGVVVEVPMPPFDVITNQPYGAPTLAEQIMLGNAVPVTNTLVPVENEQVGVDGNA